MAVCSGIDCGTCLASTGGKCKQLKDLEVVTWQELVYCLEKLADYYESAGGVPVGAIDAMRKSASFTKAQNEKVS